VVAVWPHGKEFELTLGVGQPYEISEHEWACPVLMRGLHDELRDTHGADSWQAHQLAQRLIAQLLGYFVHDGGKLLWPESRELMSLADVFPQLAPQASEPPHAA